MAILDRLLPPFTEGTRERPRDILYLAADRPPWPIAFAAGLQHAMAAVMLSIYCVVAGQGIGLEGHMLSDFLALSILVMGAGTLLSALTTRCSAGHLLVVLPGPLIMAVFVAVYHAGGPGAVTIGPLVSGLVIMVSGRLQPMLRLLFPAEVSGVLLILLGLSLVPVGIERSFGLGDGGGLPMRTDSVLIAASTLGTIVALTVWSTGLARTLSLLLGVTVGLLAAGLTGQFGLGDFTRMASVPWVSIPGSQYRAPAPTMAPTALLPYALIGIMVIRLGIVRKTECQLEGARPTDRTHRLLEDAGADWGALLDLLVRAMHVIDEVLEVLRHERAITGHARLVADFDESTLSLTVRYPGRPLRIDAAAPLDVLTLLEDDQDKAMIDDAMAGIAGTLIRHLADRAKARAIPGGGELRLEFNH